MNTARTVCNTFQVVFPRLYKLALGIQEYEGFYPSSIDHPEGSRSFRNHNPGNLRRSVMAVSFENDYAIFTDYHTGLLALLLDLLHKITGHTVTGLKGDSTLLELFNTWAPSSDHNEPAKYAAFVARRLGVKVDYKLSGLL